MGEEKINKTAYKQAEEELIQEKIKMVKGFILETLKKIEEKKKQKNIIEEELRILKLDLEDLKNGRFEKIEERIKKSKIARNVSAVDIFTKVRDYAIPMDTCTDITNTPWITLTGGTYETKDNFYYY